MKLARIEKVCRRNGEGFACKVAINRAKTLIADSQPWILRIHTTTMYGVGRNQGRSESGCFYWDRYVNDELDSC